MTLEGGEEAAAWLWREGSRRRQRDSRGREGGGSAALKGGEEAAARFRRAERRQSAEDTRSPFFLKQRELLHACMR